MRCRYVGAVPFLALALALPAAAAPPKQPQNTLDADNLASGQFTGLLLTAPGSDRTFTVRVQYQQLQLKPNALRTANNQNNAANRQLQQIARLQQQMARSKNPAQQMAQIQRIAAQMQVGQLRAQNNLYNVVNRTQDIEFMAEESVKVRTMELPEQFDEKGNVKKYTKEELKQLKGKDTKLPGYESAFESLRAGQLVQVTLADHKAKKPTTSPGDAKDKEDKDAKDKEVKEKPALDKALEKDKEKDKPALDKAVDKDTEKHKQVRMVVILKEDGGPVPGGKRGK
ncbi:MAG TPA: hypothetical protein VFE78_21340 [Gemmataceae bacterium]|nr:hypothetical protein [Gemmataceae bacterium]